MANYLPEIEGKTKTEEMHGPSMGLFPFPSNEQRQQEEYARSAKDHMIMKPSFDPRMFCG